MPGLVIEAVALPFHHPSTQTKQQDLAMEVGEVEEEQGRVVVGEEGAVVHGTVEAEGADRLDTATATATGV